MPTLLMKQRYGAMTGVQMLSALTLICCQAFFYQMTYNTIPIESMRYIGWNVVFAEIQFWLVQCYVWTLSILSFIYLGDMTEWFCRGCRWKSNETEQLGVVARTFDPFKFREHQECSICL